MAQARKSKNMAEEEISKVDESVNSKREEKLLVLVGGWPDDLDGEPYTAVSLTPCRLKLPPLPKKYMWDPLAELVKNQMPKIKGLDEQRTLFQEKRTYEARTLFTEPDKNHSG